MPDLVSIIVPVYNVEGYLSKCLDSLVNQTYQDIEILVINDGSTDNSPTICEDWANKNNKIRYFNKINEGSGATRNFGLKQAIGKYIMYVDSDDWVDSCYVEKMYFAINSNSADMAECEFFRIALDSGIKSLSKSNSVMGRNFTASERMIWGYDPIWKTITKRSFWENNHIQHPLHPPDDSPIYALMVALAKKIVSVNEPLYYYRKKRENSVCTTKQNLIQYPKTYSPIPEFKKRNLFKEYREILFHQLLRLTSRCMVPLVHQLSRDEHLKLRVQYEMEIKKDFPEYNSHRVLLLGGYNLTKIIQNSCALEDPFLRFNFMSVISLMSGGKEKRSISHRNPYRKIMLEREMDGIFLNYLNVVKPDYIIIDFIEERHDILEFNGGYYTLSDALQESDFPVERGRIIKRNSAECKELWGNACIKFIKELKNHFSANHVILIANTLAERHGDIYRSDSFKDLDDIRETNSILKEYYRFFHNRFEGIQYIDITDDSLYMADDQYEYGCYPWHLNELLNKKIGDVLQFN